MSSSFRLLAVAVSASLLFGCAKKSEETAAPPAGELSTEAQKFGYAVGVNIGQSLKPVDKYVDITALKQGLDDARSGAPLKMDDAAREEIHQAIQTKMQADQVAERESQGKKNVEEGEKFLAENAKRPEVKTTASGLQYEALKEGEGKNPTASDSVTVHYRGTLINGEEFDSSYSRNQPVSFPLANVIPGWTEGLQLMKPGAKYKLYIPSKLGYAERGAGAKIGPNSTLIFEVELLSIDKGKPGDADK